MSTTVQITVPRAAPVVHDQIIALRAQGLPIAKIARELGIARNTVKRHLRSSQIDLSVTRTALDAIIPDAIEALHKTIKAGDGKLALALLERMNAIKAQPNDNRGDTSLTVAINTLIQSNSSPATVAAHPSGHEGEGDDLSLSSPRQNSPIIDVTPEEGPK